MSALEELVGSGRVPDPLLRRGARAQIRWRLLRERLGAVRGNDPLAGAARRRSLGPVAVATDAANDQHYAVAPEFFEIVLGPRLKYSCCLYEGPGTPLAQAEEAMLALSCERAGIQDGMEVLDLGCGWGSMTTWLLERFASVRVTALSNSAAQRRHIERRAHESGAGDRLRAITVDVNDLALEARFDRVVSIEMFEHARNWSALLASVERLLAPGGELFVHTFAHRDLAYEFEGGWMADRFFTGGHMPAAGLLGRIDSPLRLDAQWWVGGSHYAHTARDWLANLDARRAEALEALALTSGSSAPKALEEWRLFFIAVEELFAMRAGREWGVVHQRLRRPAR